MTKNLDSKLKTTYSGMINPNSGMIGSANTVNLYRPELRKKLNRSTGGSRSNSVTSGGKSRNLYKTKNHSIIPM